MRAALVAGMHERPVDDRPRERLEREGPDALTDEELIAIVLGTGGPAGDTLACAARLVETMGDLRRVAGASVTELAGTVRGLGVVKAARIKAALGLASRFGERRYARGDILGSPDVVLDRFLPRLKHLDHERFWAIALDVKQRVLVELELARGDMRSVTVSPAFVYAKILREAPAGVLFVHNHPSGDPTPSEEDKALTARLGAAGELLGIAVVDHVVVAEDGFFSFRKEGGILDSARPLDRLQPCGCSP
jgi:DNA repair protein RadC